MLLLIELLIFAAITGGVYFFMSQKKTVSPKTLSLIADREEGFKGKRSFSLLNFLAAINKPLPDAFKESLTYKLSAAKLRVSAEQFLLIKELVIIGLIILFFPMLRDLSPAAYLIPVVAGFILPDIWIKVKIQGRKREIVKALPDVIDLLSLCVNAGLDFMLALKWVVEKSTPNLLTEELGFLMREINVGKPRKDALLDLAKRYDIPEVASFTRSLVQADRMGTSVADALNILSEDMRLARFRRGEQAAVKAPIKMLVPLLFFIFPVVWIIIGAPIIIQFMQQKTFAF
jgi:tight adherence protein C